MHESTHQNAVDITVSIVSYNTRDLLRDCLHSLLQREVEGEAALQIVVADNGSTDGSIEMVQAEFPSVEVFATGGNLGYGRANNLGFARARGRYFLILNSDTELPPGTLRAMLCFMEAHSAAGACGPQLVWPDGRPQTSWGQDPTLRGILAEQVGLTKFVASADDHAITDSSPDDPPFAVEQICGACQFVRSEAYRQVDGFDPAFFMYHEDVDLNMRLRRAGWELHIVPEARTVHHLGASSRRGWRQRARMVSALNWSRYHAFYNHDGAAAGQMLKAMFILGAALRLAGWTALALARPSAREKVKLFRIVLRNACRMRPGTPAQ